MLQQLSDRTSSKSLEAKLGSPIGKAEACQLYRKLILARRVEERIQEEYARDEMKTPVHLGIGQEAIPIGVCHSIPPGSQTFGTYRNHTLYLATTQDTNGLFAELYGKGTGPSKGKGGSMHVAAPEHGLMATSAIVGTTIPLAVGAALASRYRGSDTLVVSFFGDGAMEEGVFWESLNFACLRRLRLLFVCEDNGLAIHTPAHERQGFRSIPEALQGFRCHVMSGDGSDLMGVMTSTREMLERMGRHPQPGVLHFTYFRFLEHVGPREDFTAGYRRRPTSEELERLDPIRRFEHHLVQRGYQPAELEGIRKTVEEQIDRSVLAAREAPFPPSSELSTDVLSACDQAPHRAQGDSGSWGEGDIQVRIHEPDSPVANPAAQGAKARMTFGRAINLALEKAMEEDPSVFVFGLDVPDHKRIYGSTEGLVERFGPERCFGTPLSEEAMTGAALGAAISGLRPVHVHIRADFLLLAMNQIGNMVSNLRYVSGGRLRIPLVIRAVIGRGWGQSAQHSKSLHSVFGHLPGLKVVLPASPQDAYSLLRASIHDDNPVIFLEHRWLYDVNGEVDDEQAIPLGLPAVRRSGEALTVVCTSWMTVEAMKAAEVLAKRGVALEVIDVRTVAPLDERPIVESVRKTRHCIVADYDWVFCGFSAELAALISYHCFDVLKRPVERLGFAHVPCPTTRPLENLFYPSAITIIRTVERMLGLPPSDMEGESFFSHEHRFKGPF